MALASGVLVSGSVGFIGSGGAASAASSPIIICEDVALSSTFSQLGLDDALGTSAYVHAANAHGGIDGHPIKIVQENDQSVPATAATLARKCVSQDHANFVLGPEETSTSVAAIPVLNQLGVISIGYQSGWNDIGLVASARHSYAFPGNDNVFHEDDLATIQQLVAPRHYTRVAVLEDTAPGGLGNDTYTESLQNRYHFKMVASQKVTPGSTDDTPAVLALLAKKPQLIVMGLIPGPDSITAIKSIRAQNATIPISECSQCATSTFVAATGGASAMKDVYLLGTTQQLEQLPKTSANAQTRAEVKTYVADMKAAGDGSANDLAVGGPGWGIAMELANAIQTAGSTSTSKVYAALQHQKLNVLGIHFVRTPSNHGAITSVQTAMDTIASNGAPTVFGFSNGGPGE